MFKRKKRYKRTILYSILLLLCFYLVGEQDIYAKDTVQLDEKLEQHSLHKTIKKVMKKSKATSMELVIVNGAETKYLSYNNGTLIEEDGQKNLYELGSMSKAFTGLAVLKLENEGKLCCTDNINKYLPDFSVSYKGEHNNEKVDGEVPITLNNLLYHTSGIPYELLGDIEEGTSGDALEHVVQMVNGSEVDFYPGERFQYTSINYDILGYIIETVSGMSYEDYVQKKILDELNLNDTYLFQDDAIETGKLVPGLKISFFQAKEYDAPRYRGNTPAGYIISCGSDMAKWMRLQMELSNTTDEMKKAIELSHQVDTAMDNGYAAGWDFDKSTGKLSHEGSNPNYSSDLVMNSENEQGVCVLTNIDSNAAAYIADFTMNILEEKDNGTYTLDSYLLLDTASSIISICCVIAIICLLFCLIKVLHEIVSKIRNRNESGKVKVVGATLVLPLIVFYGYCIYYLPNLLFSRLCWKAVRVWCSPMVYYGGWLVFFTGALFLIYIMLIFRYTKPRQKNYISLTVLSIINGIGSAMIILCINETFNLNLEYSKELLLYFVFSLILFVFSLKVLQGRLIEIANMLAYEKRMKLIEGILGSTYETIEKVGKNRIFACLNNDCEAIMELPNMLVNFASNLLTLIFCLIYLFGNSSYVFYATLGIIALSGGMSYFTGKRSEKYWERNRNIQDTYFRQMEDLVNGFKELILNRKRKSAFKNEMERYSLSSKELKQGASIKILNFELCNTLMYNMVFGFVVFIFPILSGGTTVESLRTNLFIIFYMIGPFELLASVIPKFSQLKVNMNRIAKIMGELDLKKEIVKQAYIPVSDKLCLEYKNIYYTYTRLTDEENKAEKNFVLGPVNMKLNSGQVVFITGGNGSGKSTFGKIITGLYKPQKGDILLNQSPIGTVDLNELFASVYSDFNLFEKLYGIETNKEEISSYLEMMKIREKVVVEEDGSFQSVKNLSTGQKKRLAFIVSCLEDKAFMIFDEWAAEQDPEFRAFFYKDLLPMLKERGKGIVVITHDDRYFDLADVMVKFEEGHICNVTRAGEEENV